jgi:hypothetical protein
MKKILMVLALLGAFGVTAPASAQDKPADTSASRTRGYSRSGTGSGCSRGRRACRRAPRADCPVHGHRRQDKQR